MDQFNAITLDTVWMQQHAPHVITFTIKVILALQIIRAILPLSTHGQRWKNVQTDQTRLCYFFSLAVLIFWLCTCKLDKTLC